MWCIPPGQDAASVCDLERVLDVYRRPHDPKRPVACMDEQPRQLIRETRRPLEARPGRARRVDYEYVREGVCAVWMFAEPLGGRRDVRVGPRKTAVDRARQVKALLDDPRYAGAERFTLVCDNLSTHAAASFYRAFAPAEAHRLASRVEPVHTPKHGSWLNVAEIELSVLTRQCLSRRIPDRDEVAAEAAAWASARDARQSGVDWQFTTDDARVKLRRLYPKSIG